MPYASYQPWLERSSGVRVTPGMLHSESAARDWLIANREYCDRASGIIRDGLYDAEPHELIRWAAERLA